MAIRAEDAIEYHLHPFPGKIAISPTKPCRTQRDLSLAYTPGVAVPCLEIRDNADKVYHYTAKGNLVAVVTNGTAVLGLGNIGPAAGKPVMEGKAVLFKRFADIDVFDLELDTHDPKEVIRACQLLEPTFGGINLEDIRAPECFEIEEELRRTMRIPVFHDDQHGTAIIAGAALLNAVELAGKRIGELKAVFNGAGASGIACAEHFIRLGIGRENILMCDTHGVIYEGRIEGMNPYKARFARSTGARSLADAMRGADVFFGLSAANCLTPGMLCTMAPNPIVFAMANPDPEIAYDVAVAARKDLIMATGRSDFPNQVNNVLGFPFIFRGALDVRATTINDEMKLAATRALAALAKEDVPDSVRRAYGVEQMEFGREYIIPKPFDSRVLIWVASAVAQAAIDTGVARSPVDLEEYKEQLARRLGKAHEITRALIHKAQRRPVRVVFPEGEEPKILRACQILQEEGIARPILLGRRDRILELAAELRLDTGELLIVDPARAAMVELYAEELYHLRERKGVTRKEASQLILEPVTFGSMMVRLGDAEALVAGLTRHYPDTIRPALQVIPVREGCRKVSGMYMLITPRGQVYFLADTTVNIEPTADDLADITMEAADTVRRLDVEPRVALLSFSNFGSTRHPLAEKVRRAVEIVSQRMPQLMVDGEMQADTAVAPEIIDETYPFSRLKSGANVLIFPNLEAGNIAYKLLMRIGGAEAIGPILMGLSRPVHVLQRGCEVNDIVNVAAIAVVDANRAR
ncbi:MAG: NADP-dependent malic enzyme [Acidobacteria bacterium]|nr:NADP-dependent malic enzyme [Acidobacteriota bacterium]